VIIDIISFIIWVLFPFGYKNKKIERLYGIIYCILGVICLIIAIPVYLSVFGIIVGVILILLGLVLIFDKSDSKNPEFKQPIDKKFHQKISY